jgi:hypothetical protein
MKAEHVFVRLDEFEFEEFLQHALPALERVDPLGLLDLLSQKLERGVKAALPHEDDSYPGHTTMWVRDLDQADPIDGALAQLTRAVSSVAIRAATTKESTERVFALLEPYRREIFQRIRLRVLAAAGQYTRERVDAFFSDRAALDPPFRGREVAGVVREQFANASDEAQGAFRRGLEAGPSQLVTDGHNQADENARVQELASWQRRRLMWFRDRIPEALQHLAGRLGVTAQRHSPEDEGLAEDGFYIGGGFVGEKSPVSVDQLRELDENAFVDYVVTWRPDPSSWTSPTREGLDRMLSEYAAKHPSDALVRAQLLVSRLETADTRVAGHVQGLLDGLRAAVEAGNPVDWPDALRFLAALWPQVDARIAGEDRSSGWRPWQWLSTAVVDFVIAVSRKNAIPGNDINGLWPIVESVISSTHTWDASEDQPLESFEDVLFAALNTNGGRATEAAIEVACAVFRSSLGIPEHKATPDQLRAAAEKVAPHLEPLLEHVLTQEGRGAIAARAIVGTYLPQIHLLARGWLLEAIPRLFEGGTTTPLQSPAWGAYVTRARLFSDVFKDLRPWYVKAAIDIPTLAQPAGKREQWSVSEHLAEHIFGAFMRGLIDIGDADDLMGTVFANLPPQERAHVSWQVFRNWTDARQPISTRAVERLLRFWQWRLERLEESPTSEAKQQDLAGLTWLICTPSLPDRAVLDLGYRTLEMSTGEAAAHGTVWERLTALSAVDIDRAFGMAELLVRSTLERPHPYITLQQTEGVLTRALKARNPETRERALRLIHLLGDRGHIEFGRLLSDV